MNTKSTEMGKKGVSTTTQPIKDIEKVEQCLSIEDPRDRLYWAIGLFTALRIGEIRATKWGDIIDFRDGEAREVREIAHWVIQKKKRYDNIRPVKLPPTLRGIIWDCFLELGCPPEGAFCFIAKRGRRGNKPMSRWSINQMVRKYMVEFGIETDGNPSSHTLRKTMALAFMESLRADGDPMALEKTAQLLRHNSTQSTMSYLGLTNKQLFEDVDKVTYDLFPDSLVKALRVNHPKLANWKPMVDSLKQMMSGEQLRRALFQFFENMDIPDKLKTKDNIAEAVEELM